VVVASDWSMLGKVKVIGTTKMFGLWRDVKNNLHEGRTYVFDSFYMQKNFRLIMRLVYDIDKKIIIFFYYQGMKCMV